MKIARIFAAVLMATTVTASYSLPAHAVVAEVVSQGTGAMRAAFNRRANELYRMPAGPERDALIIAFITELASIQTVDANVRMELAVMIRVLGGNLSNAAAVQQIIASIVAAVQSGTAQTATASLGQLGGTQASGT